MMGQFVPGMVAGAGTLGDGKPQELALGQEEDEWAHESKDGPEDMSTERPKHGAWDG